MRERPIDTRSADLPRWLDPEPGVREPEQLVWFRANGPLPDDPLLHDVRRRVRIRPHAARHRGDGARELVGRRPVHDREPRPRDVVPPAAARPTSGSCTTRRSPSAQAGRGLAEGFIYRRDGALAVTVMQEGLIRPVEARLADRMKPDWVCSRASISARDTVTAPTAEMRRAMADAEVGDDVYREDPTVNRLESLAAGLLGKQAALYVPSGTMANQLALRVREHAPAPKCCARRVPTCTGTKPRPRRMNSGVQLHPLPDDDGAIAEDAVALAFAGAAHHLPPVSLALAREHAHAGVRTAAHRRARSARSRGSRTRTAPESTLTVRASGTPPIALGHAAGRARGRGRHRRCSACRRGWARRSGRCCADPSTVIEAARAQRQRLGGGMRQAGVIAAAGIVALETMVERLADDHARAHRLAEALAERFPAARRSRDGADEHRVRGVGRAPGRLRRAASRPPVFARERSIPRRSASSRTRTSTTTTSTRRSRRSTTIAAE